MGDAARIVPFLDLGATYRELRTELDEAYQRVMESGWFVLGQELSGFEEEFAQFVGARRCVGVGTGLDALSLSLRALGIGPGDEVIVPSNTYIATWLAVTSVGAAPVPVEPDPATYNLDPGRVAAAITGRTRAILPVHLYGRPADLHPLLDLARECGLHTVEDAAQAHGAEYHGRRVGASGDLTCWSFYPGKNLGAFGDGGAVTTNSVELADRLEVLRNYGSRTKYIHEERGVNSRLDEMQAAFLRTKLQVLESWNLRRSRLASFYSEHLAGTPHLGLPEPDSTRSRSSWHLYVVRHPERDRVQRELSAQGIQTLIQLPIPPHMQGALTLATGVNPSPLRRCLLARF